MSKHITEKEDTTSPEHYLWISVLSKAAHDAIYRIALKAYSHEAGSSDVREFAGKLDYLQIECRLLLLKAFEEFQSL